MEAIKDAHRQITKLTESIHRKRKNRGYAGLHDYPCNPPLHHEKRPGSRGDNLVSKVRRFLSSSDVELPALDIQDFHVLF